MRVLTIEDMKYHDDGDIPRQLSSGVDIPDKGAPSFNMKFLGHPLYNQKMKTGQCLEVTSCKDEATGIVIRADTFVNNTTFLMNNNADIKLRDLAAHTNAAIVNEVLQWKAFQKWVEALGDYPFPKDTVILLFADRDTHRGTADSRNKIYEMVERDCDMRDMIHKLKSM